MTTETSSSSGLDSAPFRPEAIAAETAQFSEQLRELMAGTPAIHEQEPREIRAARAAGGGWLGEIVRLVHAEERSIPGPAGEISLRVFTPETLNGVYLHLHGGEQLAVYPGGTHGFSAMPIEIGRQATARMNEFSGDAVSGGQ